MAEVNHREIFNCTPDQFFKIISDYNSYASFLKEVSHCQVVEDKGSSQIVEYEVSVIKTLRYTNEHFSEAPNKMSWVFLKGDLFKNMKGSWTLQEVNGKTQADYYLEANFGLFVPKTMTKTALSVNLPAMMKSYHDRVAELYGG